MPKDERAVMTPRGCLENPNARPFLSFRSRGARHFGGARAVIFIPLRQICDSISSLTDQHFLPCDLIDLLIPLNHQETLHASVSADSTIAYLYTHHASAQSTFFGLHIATIHLPHASFHPILWHISVDVSSDSLGGRTDQQAKSK